MHAHTQTHRLVSLSLPPPPLLTHTGASFLVARVCVCVCPRAACTDAVLLMRAFRGGVPPATIHQRIPHFLQEPSAANGVSTIHADTKERSGSRARSRSRSWSGWNKRCWLQTAAQAVCVLIGLSSLEDNSLCVCVCVREWVGECVCGCLVVGIILNVS